MIDTDASPIIVKDADGSITYEAGKDYVVLPGEVRYGYSWRNAPWQIERVDGGRIAPGQDVLVTYDHAPSGTITYCPSDSRTQAIMKRSIERTIEVLKPRYVHIGHDEPRHINRDRRCKAQKRSKIRMMNQD